MSGHLYRKSNILILILWLSSLGLSQVGYLSIINGNNLSVYIDSTFISDSSFQDLPLSSGEYTVYALDINSNPYGSMVFYQDSLLGTTPLLLSEKIFSRKSLTIRQQGYDDQNIRITDGSGAYFIDLNTSNNKDGISYVVAGNNNDSGRRWYREGLVVTSIISGWTAFYFKREADKYYTTYEHAADPQAIISLYDKTRTYDLYSEIALTVSATTLATYLWLLIIE
jgi:hypothetical protein